MARALADVQARLILTLLYFVALAPFALVLRWVSDPLEMKRARSRAWKTRLPDDEADLHKARRQY